MVSAVKSLREKLILVVLDNFGNEIRQTGAFSYIYICVSDMFHLATNEYLEIIDLDFCLVCSH